MPQPTFPKEIYLAGIETGQIRFLAIIPHGRGTQEVAVDISPDLILRIADALRATQGTACDARTSHHTDEPNKSLHEEHAVRHVEHAVWHVEHAVWHVEHPKSPMPCIDARSHIHDGCVYPGNQKCRYADRCQFPSRCLRHNP
jgi:hypothetical protein